MISRLKWVANLAVRAEDHGVLPYVGLESVESGTRRLLDAGGLTEATAAQSGVASVVPGDVLFGKLRPYLAKVWMADRHVYASTELLCLRPQPHIVPGWLSYVLSSSPFIQWAVATSEGAKMPRTSWEKLRDFRVEIPPQQAQRAIADYLDRETARIDALIAMKRRMVELLEERFDITVFNHIIGQQNPGPRKAIHLTWVVSIPQTWSTPPVRANFDVQLGKMLSADASTGPQQRPYLRNVNVQWDKIDISDVAHMHFDDNERRKFRLRWGDLLVCEGGEVGRAAIWGGQIDECYFQKALHCVRPQRKANARYLMYCLHAAAKRGVFTIEGNMSTIVHLTREQLRAHHFPWPPLSEQYQIVAQLDNLASTTRDATSVVDREIALLHEHRQALITAAVTGQLDIPKQEAVGAA